MALNLGGLYYACPKCGRGESMNFRKETRITFRESPETGLLQEAGTKEVYVCVNCNSIMTPPTEAKRKAPVTPPAAPVPPAPAKTVKRG